MRSFLWKIYLSRFLDTFILIGVIFALFFSEHGLNPLQISYLISIWSITTILTEIPFGVLADTYSRRNLLVVGLVLRAVGFGFWMMGGFLNYAIGFVLWGLKNTLTSGTLEALVYDELAYYRREDDYEEVSGKMGSAFSLGLFLSAIFGGLVAQIDFTYVLMASVATTILSAAVLSTLKSVKAVQSTGEVNYYQTLKDAVLEIKRNPTLLYVIVFICIIFAAFGAYDEYWALVYTKFGLSETVMGLLVALVYGLGSIAGSTVKYFKKSPKYLGYVLIAAGAVLYILVGITNALVLLPLAFMAIYLFQIASIKLEAQLQRNITSRQRSTISSIKSLLFELVYMGYVVLFGFVGTRWGILSGLVAAGMVILLSISLLPLLKPKRIDG